MTHDTPPIAVLHPGDMGAAIAGCLVKRGYPVLWASEGRGEETRARAMRAGAQDRGSLAACLQAAPIALSVCPPHAARQLAEQVATIGYRGLYVDANAISPAHARDIEATVTAQGARFVDGGIVGPPPREAGRTRMFVSGAAASQVATLFEQTALEIVVLPAEAGAASAVKACYAAWTKGSLALLTAIRVAARLEGVEAALLDEWQRSQPDLPRRSAMIAGQASKAWRWIGEMEEIAETFAANALPEGFHRASAELYRMLEGVQPAEGNSLEELLKRLTAAAGGPARR